MKDSMQLQKGRHVAALLASLGLALVGCESPDWSDPAYIAQQLEQGDPTAKALAIENAGALTDEQKRELAPALAKVYLEGGSNEKDAMSMLVQLRVPAAQEAYLEEVKQNRAGYAAAAAEALGEAEVKEAIPDMIKLLKDSDDTDVKLGVMRGFENMPDAAMIPVLVETLKLDADNHRIALHSYACTILGDIAQDSPEALDEDAKRTLVMGMFISNTMSQNVERECSLAVQQMGKAAVPVLIDLFNGEIERVNNLLIKYNQQKYLFPPNHVEFMASKRLATLQADEAVELFVTKLEETKEIPEKLPGSAVSTFMAKEVQGSSEFILGLGDLGAKEGYDTLVKAMRGDLNDEWSAMLRNSLYELQLRQNAALALNRVGDRRALGEMLEVVKRGDIDDFKGRKMPALTRYQFNWMVAQAYANLATGEQLADFKPVVDGAEDAELKKKYESFLPKFGVAAECMAEDGDAKQAACYGGKLGDEDAMVREKAAFELMRLEPSAAASVINEHLDTEHVDTRELLTLGAYRACAEGGSDCAKIVKTIEAILEDESERTADKFKIDHWRLGMLHAWLKHRA